MDAMTQQNAALVEEATAAAQALKAQATSLMQMMGHYRLQLATDAPAAIWPGSGGARARA
jgi:methyl-accepting chemotaxis protein